MEISAGTPCAGARKRTARSRALSRSIVRQFHGLVLGLALALALAGCQDKGPEKPEKVVNRDSFSAEGIRRFPDKRTQPFRVFAAPGMIRLEDEERAAIAREDRDVVWILDLGNKTWTGYELGGPGGPAGFSRNESGRDLGTEKLLGLECRKTALDANASGLVGPGLESLAKGDQELERILSSLGEASREVAVWRAKGVSFPLKLTTGDGYSEELTRIVFGPQEAGLFEIPEGFTQVEFKP